MRDLLAALNEALAARRECVYCSVVETRGSTPQKAGAAMLVFADGSQAGTLGGGCVEAEVKRQALRTLAAGPAKPDLHSFCLDDNYGWDDGLICGGRMSMLVDPLVKRPSEVQNPESRAPCPSSPAEAYYQHFQQLVETGQGCTEAVVIKENAGPAVGSRYLFDAEGRLAVWLGDEVTPDEVMRQLIPLSRRPRPFTQQGIAYLPILPRITLLIVGGGHVGQAVARLAAEVDFDIWVLDDRETYASRERFPRAQKIVVGDIGSRLQELAPDITPSTFCIIVTRGHAHDEEALYHLVRSGAGYVGMIGSKRKIKIIYEDLVAKGIPAETLGKVHAPLGFAIGSQTVPEIAVSIVAELISCRNLGQTIPSARLNVPI